MSVSPVISKTLKVYFERKQKKNPNLSVRWLAQKLAISPAMTSMILNGKRLPALQILEELCRLLDIDHEEEDRLRLNILLNKNMVSDPSDFSFSKGERQEPAVDSQWDLAETSQFVALQEWYYFAIMQTMLLKAYDGSACFVADFLGQEESTISSAIDELVEVGLIEKDPKSGAFRKVHKKSQFMSRDRKRLSAHHVANMKKVIAVLEDDAKDENVESRLVTSSCFSCKKSDIPLMKQKIASFLREIAGTDESEGHDEVCLFLVQLLPLSQTSLSEK